MFRAAKVVFVNVVVLLVLLVLTEVALRVVFPTPTHGGVYLDSKGRPFRPSADPLTLKPKSAFDHLASEFRVRVTTNAFGYRSAPGSDRPDVDHVFLGDSFTFGHGIGDGWTFVDLFCSARAVRCQNLGRSGTATSSQRDILAYAIARKITAKQINVFVLASCNLAVSGNDLSRNLERRAEVPKKTVPPSPPGAAPAAAQSTQTTQSVFKVIQHYVLQTEIFRRIYGALAARVKQRLSACNSPVSVASAVDATVARLREIQNLAVGIGAKMAVFLIFPYQDLDGEHVVVERELAAKGDIGFPIFSTAADLSPADYFSYDGHLNMAGHRKIADILIKRFGPAS